MATSLGAVEKFSVLFSRNAFFKKLSNYEHLQKSTVCLSILL